MIRSYLEQGLAESGLAISEEQVRAFELFVRELKKWNRTINLTAITDDRDIAVKHIIDALMCAACVGDVETVLDIGSGAGIPAIPLKIVKPNISVVSVDAVGKKILFQRHAARLLGLKGFQALHVRVENLHGTHAGRFDVVTSRAFSRLEQFTSLAAPLMAEGGRLIAMKGPGGDMETEAAEGHIRDLGFGIDSVTRYHLPLGMGERCLIVLTRCKSA